MTRSGLFLLQQRLPDDNGGVVQAPQRHGQELASCVQGEALEIWRFFLGRRVFLTLFGVCRR